MCFEIKKESEIKGFLLNVSFYVRFLAICISYYLYFMYLDNLLATYNNHNNYKLLYL